MLEIKGWGVLWKEEFNYGSFEVGVLGDFLNCGREGDKKIMKMCRVLFESLFFY